VGEDGFRQRLIDRFPLVDGHPDVAGVLRDPELLAGLGPAMAGPFRSAGVTHVVAPEARGPILGALVAVELGAGLVMARKEGQNHPGARTVLSTGPTWRGTAQRFITRGFDLAAGDRVLVVDDWVTTGESALALRRWATDQGAQVVGTVALVDKTEGDTAELLGLTALVRFAEIAARTPAPGP
jgi:adenine phosphoribosyltransferase